MPIDEFSGEMAKIYSVMFEGPPVTVLWHSGMKECVYDKRHTRDRMLIAVKIADALEAKKLSQKDFAKLMDKSESEISGWLSESIPDRS